LRNGKQTEVTHKLWRQATGADVPGASWLISRIAWALDIKLLILIVAVCCPAGVKYATAAPQMRPGIRGRGRRPTRPRRWVTRARYRRRCRGRAARGGQPARHAECFLRSCRWRQLSLLRVTTYFGRPRYGT